jgi:hypothetical protein
LICGKLGKPELKHTEKGERFIARDRGFA